MEGGGEAVERSSKKEKGLMDKDRSVMIAHEMGEGGINGKGKVQLNFLKKIKKQQTKTGHSPQPEGL